MRKMVLLFLCVCSLVGCAEKEKKLKVAATPVPHAEMLEYIKPDLAEKGIDLQVVEVDDYQLPNRLLAEKQVDANFFQHLPFLESMRSQFGDSLVVLARIHVEPLGIYSKKIATLDQVREGSVVAIPCDPSNETRAILLLRSLHLIDVKDAKKPWLDVTDITSNPKKLSIQEIDSPLLPRVLPDVEMAVIPGNFALQVHLEPERDALALEDSLAYANVLVVRKGDEKRKDLQELAAALKSEKMKKFLEEKYQGTIKLVGAMN